MKPKPKVKVRIYVKLEVRVQVRVQRWFFMGHLQTLGCVIETFDGIINSLFF
ncbi:MAG: hypothetical protein ACJAW8_000505 [Oleispira sp.]|jgi:hypothetical protein|tara:strand:- start:1495 stop:1650 length:156 start_codon:yes stop_codon:yes gene_type:complete